MSAFLRAATLLVTTQLFLPPLVGRAQSEQAPPDAEIVGLVSMTTGAFSDLVKEHCGGKY